MMIMVSIGLLKFVKDLRVEKSIIPLIITVAGSLMVNMAIGFVAGIISHYFIKRMYPYEK